MEIEIIEEKENPFLKRKEIIAKLKFDGATPSKAELQKKFAEKFSAEREQVEISKIMSDFGRPAGKVWIKIWNEKKVPVYKTKASEDKKEINHEETKSKTESGKEEVEKTSENKKESADK